MISQPGRIAVSVNGKSRQVDVGTTVAGLLNRHGVESGASAVEINREVVPRSTYGDRRLRPGDTVEIVTFVGGG